MEREDLKAAIQEIIESNGGEATLAEIMEIGQWEKFLYTEQYIRIQTVHLRQEGVLDRKRIGNVYVYFIRGE